MQMQMPMQQQQMMMMSSPAMQVPDFHSLVKRRTRSPTEITIPTTSKTHDKHGNHTLYTVQVAIRGVLPARDIVWTIGHTFSEFEHFHKAMKHPLQINHLENMLKMPSGSIVHHEDAAHIEKRRSELEKYLQAMYTRLSPSEIPDFDNFLLFGLNVNEAIAEVEIAFNRQSHAQLSQQMMPPPNMMTGYPNGGFPNGTPSFYSQGPPPLGMIPQQGSQPMMLVQQQGSSANMLPQQQPQQMVMMMPPPAYTPAAPSAPPLTWGLYNRIY